MDHNATLRPMDPIQCSRCGARGFLYNAPGDSFAHGVLRVHLFGDSPANWINHDQYFHSTLCSSCGEKLFAFLTGVNAETEINDSIVLQAYKRMEGPQLSKALERAKISFPTLVDHHSFGLFRAGFYAGAETEGCKQPTDETKEKT